MRTGLADQKESSLVLTPSVWITNSMFVIHTPLVKSERFVFRGRVVAPASLSLGFAFLTGVVAPDTKHFSRERGESLQCWLWE